MSQISMIRDSTENERYPLSIRDLSVDFKTKGGVLHAVGKVSFDVRESEVLSIVGESGSGKTTVARCITRLTKPSSGSIKCYGTEIGNLRGKELIDYRRKVQMIFQDPFESLNPRQDVFTAVSTPIQSLLGEKDQHRLYELVTELLEEVGLNPKLVMYRFPHQISGGEKQRVSIARALSVNPKILVADEPITMLDSAQRLNVLSILKQLKEKRNMTVVMITHDLASAKLLSDRVIVMYRGKVFETGITEQLLEHPSHPYTELILASMPDVDVDKSKVETVGDKWEAKRIPLSGCVFSPRCKYATEICHQVEPALETKSPDHIAACHNALS